MVLGAQVELRQDQISALRRPPALEEVLRSIRGGFLSVYLCAWICKASA